MKKNWTWGGLNSRPPACEADMLPLHYRPFTPPSNELLGKEFNFKNKWKETKASDICVRLNFYSLIEIKYIGAKSLKAQKYYIYLC